MWFKRHHHDLSLMVTQGLEIGCTKGLCLANVASFYANLIEAYNAHHYQAIQIWNCDKSSGQGG
jgi:hypothetical protein